jgi:hypothetical protein
MTKGVWNLLRPQNGEYATPQVYHDPSRIVTGAGQRIQRILQSQGNLIVMQSAIVDRLM